MRRDPKPEELDLYEFKMALFENSKSEEFLLFIRNFQLIVKAPGVLASSTKIQHVCTLLHGEALHQLGNLCVEVGSMTTTHLNHIVLGLGTYFLPIHVLSKQKRAICHGMRKRRELKVKRYTAHIIDLNKYLSALTGVKASNRIGET